MTLSNDSMEGMIQSKIGQLFCSNENLDQKQTETVESTLKLLPDLYPGYGFCLSKDGDMLSQWRGYADDGEGVSIGFSKTYLDEMSTHRDKTRDNNFNIEEVVYDEKAQEERLRPIFRKVLEEIRTPRGIKIRHLEGEVDAFVAVLSQYKLLKDRLYCLKSNAFKEEKEVRLLKIPGRGANSMIDFHQSGNKIVPHIEFCIDHKSGPNKSRYRPINSVIIGPKNQTPEKVIEALLQPWGVSAECITPSSAAYR